MRRATAVVFPFDNFGSGGTGAGAALLADALRELLADNRRETVPTRAAAYSRRLRLREVAFETPADVTAWRARGREFASQALADGDFLLWLGGNHLGALPIYDALAGTGDDTLVVQLDAHLDIHHFADCTSELSHGNFLRHVAGPLPPLVNVGHRDLLLRSEDIAPFFRAVHSAEELCVAPAQVLEALRDRRRSAKRVFLDLDCDVFDPAFFSAVAEPVPFGLSPSQVLAIIDAVWGDGLAGVFVSEFLPARDRDDRCLATLLWLVERLLLRRFERPV